MAFANADTSPADALAAIIAAGVARYESTLPDFARAPIADIEAPQPIITLGEERQAQICLSCHLVECVDVTDARYPIRITQRAEWRR